MHPYRDLPEPPYEHADESREELVVYGLLVAVGAIPVATALVHHTRFAGEATIGLVMACAGMLGLLRTRR